ncbi:MAG: DNA internalization-related competence protein ComEC/Rec2 [Lentilactobacillus hilgardii]
MLFLSILLFGNPLIGSFLLSLLMIRLCLLKSVKYTTLTVALSVVFLFWVGLTTSHEIAITDKNVQETIKVYPDMINVDGDRFRTVAKSPTIARKVIYYARFESLSQKRAIINSSKPLLLSINGERRMISPATNMNQFDMRDYYQHQKIYETFSIGTITTIHPVNKLSLIDIIHMVRFQFDRYCDGLPKTLRIYSMGLISGNRENDFFTEMTGAQQLGLLHIFSISGMHVYYFLTILDQVLTLLGIGDRFKAIVKLCCLGGYFIFSGGSPGLLRAVVMAGIVIVSQLLGFKMSQLSALSLTLIVNLFLLPEAMFMMSVQLSYGLAFGLIASSKMTYLRQTVLLNLLSLPILLFHLYEWHVLSLAVNLIVLPLFGRTIFPLVIFGLLFGLVSSKLAIPVEWVLMAFNRSLNMIGRLPGMIVFGKPQLVVVLLMLGLTLIVMIHSKKRVRGYKVILAGLYLVTFIWIHFPIHGEVSMFDVGQGDSFLIRTPLNQSVTIIDTGGKVTFNQQQWRRVTENYQANRISINYLKSIGISRIDNICISHQDADHCGDLPAFIKELKIKRIIIPLGMDQNPGFVKRLSGKDPATVVMPVNDEFRVGGLPLIIFHPYQPGKGENHDSEVLGGRFGGLNWLFTGDLDRQGEMDTLQRHPSLRTDVIKVGHHGSRTSSDPAFISQIQPKIALISAGRHNRYHHPNEETLTTLKREHIRVLNTQKSGMVRYVYRNNNGFFESMLGHNEGKNE